MNVFPMEYSNVYFQNDPLRLNIPVIFKMACFLSSMPRIFCHIIQFLHWRHNNTQFISILDKINTKFAFNILGNDLTYLFSKSQWHLTSS